MTAAKSDAKNAAKRKATAKELAHKRKRYSDSPDVKQRASTIKKIQYACEKGKKPKDEHLAYLGYPSLAEFAKDYKCKNLHLQEDSANLPAMSPLPRKPRTNKTPKKGSVSTKNKKASSTSKKPVVETPKEKPVSVQALSSSAVDSQKSGYPYCVVM